MSLSFIEMGVAFSMIRRLQGTTTHITIYKLNRDILHPLHGLVVTPSKSSLNDIYVEREADS